MSKIQIQLKDGRNIKSRIVRGYRADYGAEFQKPYRRKVFRRIVLSPYDKRLYDSGRRFLSGRTRTA